MMKRRECNGSKNPSTEKSVFGNDTTLTAAFIAGLRRLMRKSRSRRLCGEDDATSFRSGGSGSKFVSTRREVGPKLVSKKQTGSLSQHRLSTTVCLAKSRFPLSIETSSNPHPAAVAKSVRCPTFSRVRKKCFASAGNRWHCDHVHTAAVYVGKCLRAQNKCA